MKTNSIMMLGTLGEGLVEIYWCQCSNCKSCNSSAPNSVCLGLLNPTVGWTRHWRRQSWKCKMMLQNGHRHWHWSSYMMLWMELGSNQSSQCHLLLPSHQHSIGLSISSLAAPLGMKLFSIPCSWILLLGSHPLRSWNIHMNHHGLINTIHAVKYQSLVALTLIEACINMIH